MGNQVHDEMADALRSIFAENIYLKKAIMKSFKNHKEWDNLVKKYFLDSMYDIVRYWRLLWYLTKMDQSLKKEDILHLIDTYLYYRENRLFPGNKIDHIDNRTFEKTLFDAQKVRELRESIPDWLDNIGVEEFGKRWDSIIKALNQKPHDVIRTNTLKVTSDELIKILKNEGVNSKKIERMPDALIIQGGARLFELQSFIDGFFELQNNASQMVSIFLDAKPGMRVVDACAGEGGKSLHLAALMHNKGKIIALDTKHWKLKELRRRATKAGAENIEIRHIDSSKAYKRLKETADRVLLDVPCSGLGTLRRNPEIKWKLTPTDLERLTDLQRNLLERYSPLVCKKGCFVYSVCSILSSEGKQQIQSFLERHGNEFQLVKEKQYWPDIDDTDGFYMALLERTNTS